MVGETVRPDRSLIDVLKRRSTVALCTFVVVVLLAAAFASIHKTKYGSVSHVLLVSEPNGRDPADTGVDMPTIATGSSVLMAVKQKLHLADTLGDLRKDVTARVAPRSSLMTIGVLHHDPNRSIQIDNAVAETFSQLYFQIAGQRYDEVSRRLHDDVQAAEKRVGDLDRRLERASAGTTYVGTQASLDASAAHLGDLQEARGVAFAQLTADRANLQADLGMPGKTAKVVRFEILHNNAAYRETETNVGRDVAQYTTTRAGVKANYPGVRGFEDKIDQEAAALNRLRTAALDGRDAYSPSAAGQLVQTQKDQSAVAGDESRVAAYDAQIGALRRQLSHPPSSLPSIGALRAQRDASEAQLQQLSLALSQSEASRAQASALGEVVIVDRATEAHPTLVGPLFLFILGLVGAFALAIAAAYIAELLVPRLIGSRDVESIYGRPILATLRAQ